MTVNIVTTRCLSTSYHRLTRSYRCRSILPSSQQQQQQQQRKTQKIQLQQVTHIYKDQVKTNSVQSTHNVRRFTLRLQI